MTCSKIIFPWLVIIVNDILFFPIITTKEDDLGQVEENEEYSNQVFCEKKPIAQSEFFSAGQTGIKPSKCLVVSILDYEEQEKLMFGNKIYSIYRTYERKDERIELFCEVRVGG